MGVRVKICGITNLEDALTSAKAGCDALGFVFYSKSPRVIAIKKARDIIRHIPKGVIKVGVFVNSREKTIKNIAKLCRLDILQFHGNESVEFCKRFKNYKIIKTFRVKDKDSFKDITRYKTFACLFDTYAKSKAGGTGKIFNWQLLRHIGKIKCPIFLSGGLNSRNVRAAVKALRPDWVDASSSLEIKPGKKDSSKVKDFVKAAKERS